jgi:hypothetical protein
MSKFDKVDVHVLRRTCCLAAIHKRIALAAEGTRLDCTGCHQQIEFRYGRWRAAEPFMAGPLP